MELAILSITHSLASWFHTSHCCQTAAEIAGLDTEQKALVCYQRFPIVGAVPKEETFEQIFVAIQESQGAGRKALVHCMIGTGRTSESFSDHGLRVVVLLSMAKRI